jgi:uncharacterized CHY-type Zn-finger protein
MISNKNPEMEKFLDDLSLGMFGRFRSLAQAGKACVFCGKPATEFRDELSRREYGISSTCQQCQDEVFKDPEE